MTNIPESTPQDPESTPAKPAEQRQKPVAARPHDAEITHNRVGPHPWPEETDPKTVGEIADMFWAKHIWPAIVEEHTKRPGIGGV